MLRFLKNRTPFNWRYALGEVVLIFVGITLAIWFDAWSAGREDQSKREQYLAGLKQDLHKDIQEYDSLLLANRSRIKDINSLGRLLADPSATAYCDSLQRYVVSSCFVNVFTGSFTVIEDLKSTGNLALLEDTSLKNKLLAYYAHTESRKKYEELNTRFHINTSGSFLNEHWNVGSMLRLGLGDTGLNANLLSTDCGNTLEVFGRIRDQPSDRQRMMNVTSFSYFFISMNNEEYQTLKTEATELVEAIYDL